MSKPGRKTNTYRDRVADPSEITDYVYTSTGLLGRVAIRHDKKRLEFRIDPSDRQTLSTRIDELIDALADVHRVDRAQVRKKALRDADLLFAQQTIWFVLNTRWGLPHSLIASYFDHHRTTIMHGCNNCRDAYDTDPGFARYIELLPFYANLDIEGGRIIALQALFSPKGSIGTPEGVKTQPRARKGPKNGIVGEHNSNE